MMKKRVWKALETKFGHINKFLTIKRSFSSNTTKISTCGSEWPNHQTVNLSVKADLSKKPYHMREDGYIIGYLVHDKGATIEDDFQTLEDKNYKAALEVKTDIQANFKKSKDTHSFQMKINV